MNRPAVIFHAGFWSVAFLFWAMCTKAHHPTVVVRLLSTLILVGTSAVYACCGSPRGWTTKQLARAAVALIVAGFVAATLIYWIYDALVGPDPRRFSFLTNVWIDAVFVLVQTTIAALGAWSVHKITRRQVWSLRAAG